MPLPDDYVERVYAGVLGKIIGVYLGRPFEGWTYERILQELGPVQYYVHERLGKPLVVTDDDITGTFTSADDAVVTSSAIEKTDLPNLYISFPRLKSLSSTPLYRESSIQPGADGEGMVVFGFPIDQATWDKRKSATITVDLYHQGQFTTEIPKTAPTGK